MSSKTKIVVLRMKEIIYTAIFIGLGILLICLFLVMFRPGKEAAPSWSETCSYTPGVYTSSLKLGSEQVNVQVTVDSDSIRSVSIIPLSEAVTTMYPLMQPAMDDLAKQIVDTQSLEGLSYPSESRYTSEALIQAAGRALHKAEKQAEK
ncbi:hypothetical protein AALB16_00195 [Lachnospiraceae bacterium 62-35]